MRTLVIATVFLALACSPAVISRIGPTVPARGEDCEIEILGEGEKPNRPYRDVGMVSLSNCQDYDVMPCREWLRKAACEVGGHVAYLPEKERPDSQMGHVTYRVMVAAYMADLRPDLSDDPFLKSRTCDPLCADGERCENKECIPDNVRDCGDPEKVKDDSSAEPERCMD